MTKKELESLKFSIKYLSRVAARYYDIDRDVFNKLGDAAYALMKIVEEEQK